MNLKDLLFNIYISIFGDRKKKLFMIELIKLTNTYPEYSKIIQLKSCGNSLYLEELYQYWLVNGSIEPKIKYDIAKYFEY